MSQRFSIAIVGAGPAGYFTAQALQNLQTEERKFSIDMYERLPTPWGLVRSGVAPDHPKIKTVSKVFEKIATTEGFRLFGNIELGTDVTLEDLKKNYDAVVIATGSAQGKKLGIPGEELPGSYSAAEIVPWYNGHPDFANFKVDLNSETAVVIGAGNVAMDVGRMFALDPHELDSTDTADHALIALHASSIRKTFICGRRGPEHAAFTAPELRELPKLEHTDVYLDPESISQAQSRAEMLGEIEKDLRSNLEAMKSVAEADKKGNTRSLTFKFLSTPLEIRGSEKVEEIIFGINKVDGDKVVSTGETYSIKCGIVVSAIGYEAIHLDGLPYEKGRVINTDGRVSENVYVVGWAKRGPSGVIGTNKSDASTVVDLLVSDLKEPKVNPGIDVLLKGKTIVDQTGWTKINSKEISEGEITGKPRKKIVSTEQMIKVAIN